MNIKKINPLNIGMTKEQLDELVTEKARLSERSRSVIEIFDQKEVRALYAKQPSKSPLKPFLEKMLQEGNLRKLQTVSKNLIKNVETLENSFPNFSDVISFIAKHLSLLKLSKPSIITIPPILLIGEPGAGKTRFLSELAEVLRLDFYQLDLASTSAGFVLSGSSTSWSDGKPGLVTDYLRSSKTANYIFLLDELDKASGDARHDPLGSLYSLLEKRTAARFVDESLTIPMDCSYINWFASANYYEQIPMAIRSRFTIFRIKQPSLEQQRVITTSVYRDILKDNKWGKKYSPSLQKQVIDLITSLSAREQKRILLRACAEVAYRSNKPVTKDLLSVEPDDIKINDIQPKKRAIGFY